MSDTIIQPDPEEENVSEQIEVQESELEINDKIYIPLRVKTNNGQVTEIVGEINEPRTDTLLQEGLLIDELEMDALEEFFRNADVTFIGNPWVAYDQEDFLGDISINCAQLNDALMNKKLVLKKDPSSNYLSFEGLDEFVDKFKNEHYGDEKYDEEDFSAPDE